MLLFALNNWRVLLMGTIVLVLGTTAGFYKWRSGVWEGRYETEKAAFSTFRAEVAAVADAAKKEADQKKKQQDRRTREVGDVYESTRRRVSDFYGNGLRLPAVQSGGGGVPAAPDYPPRPDGTAEERGPSGEVTVQACALDAAQVLAFQDWVRKQGIPVD